MTPIRPYPTPGRTIRPAQLPADAEAIMAAFTAAKATMTASGNAHQWRTGYPSLDAVHRDAQQHGAYVVEEAGRVVAYFAFLPSPDPTYDRIYEGQWIDADSPYHVVHRLASMPSVHGVFGSVMAFCAEREPNLRVDTHRDNRIMQHLLARHGFSYCGIIHQPSGEERLAYQRLCPRQQAGAAASSLTSH